jgi:hypothetical protein
MNAVQILPALLVVLPAAAWAQGVAVADPQGVYLDNEGVLRRREKDADDRLAEIRKRAGSKDKDPALCYISLPRLFAEAKKHLDAGEPLPDRIRYLGGLVKLQYIFVFPEEGDLVIAGPAEPFSSKAAYRPLGEKTGRPVLHLDDLVVALRACGPGTKAGRIGCDIEVTQEIVDRCSAKLRELMPKAQEIGARKVADQVADAGGSQALKYYGVGPATRFAVVCAEADYKLKELALGLVKSPVSKVRPYNDMLTKPERHHRFSLDTHYEALVVSADGNAFELRGPSLKINSGLLQRLGAQAGEMSDAARRFMDGCNRHFDDMSRALLSWSDLANLSDLTVLAALIAKDELHTRARWDLSWVVDAKGYPVTEYAPVKAAHRLCNFNYGGSMLVFTHGGVFLNPVDWASKRTPDEGEALKGRARRPDGEIQIPTAPAR